MEEKLKQIKEILSKELFEAKNASDVALIKAKYLGKQGQISELLKGMKDVPIEQKAKVGAMINACKVEAEEAIKQTENTIIEKELEEKLLSEKIDVTLNKKFHKKGSLHPILESMEKISQILIELGFKQGDGPEVEIEKYNFERLNTPKGHPARDMQDTFYINGDILLRTQTSSAQARILEGNKPPFKFFAPGRVFRLDDLDATHAPAFYQVEGIVVDEKLSMADLKNTLLVILKKLLGEKTHIRFRTSYFPFTEPSVEVDATCNFCDGKGCPACKGQGYIEMLGAGMVHPKVLEDAGIDSKKYSGYAFAFGIDRMSKMEHEVLDMRSFYSNDTRFLDQF